MMDFTLDESALEAQLTEEVNAEAMKRLENAKAIAYNNCPVDTGLLRSTIRIEDGQEEKALVYGNEEADYAEYIEYGTRFMQAYNVLGNAMDALTRDD